MTRATRIKLLTEQINIYFSIMQSAKKGIADAREKGKDDNLQLNINALENATDHFNKLSFDLYKELKVFNPS